MLLAQRKNGTICGCKCPGGNGLQSSRVCKNGTIYGTNFGTVEAIRHYVILLTRIFAGYRVKSGLDLKRSEIGIPFDKSCNYAADMRAGKAVAGQVSMSAAKPRRAYVYPRRREFDDLTIMKSEFERISFLALYHRDQR